MSARMESHKKEILAALETQIVEGLEICGQIAEGYAKQALQASQAQDTGFLTNSVTYAISKQAPKIKTYKANRGGRTGSYEGQAPAEEAGASLYLGTNVEYAAYVELGTGVYYPGGRKTPWAFKGSDGKWHRTKGMPARPYIKPALANHTDEFRKALQEALKK